MDNRIKGFILRGLAAGAAGGAAAALFLRFVTETQIGAALRFEDATGLGLPPGEAAEFSRGTQHWGGMAAAVIYGSLLGVVLGVVVAALHHRLSGAQRVRAGGQGRRRAFVALVLIPALKYPPNPPTVGDPDTIGQRSTQFLLLMVASVVVVAAGWYLWEQLTERGWNGAPRFLVGGGAFVADGRRVLMLVWPASPDPIAPPDNEAAPALRGLGRRAARRARRDARHRPGDRRRLAPRPGRARPAARPRHGPVPRGPGRRAGRGRAPPGWWRTRYTRSSGTSGCSRSAGSRSCGR